MTPEELKELQATLWKSADEEIAVKNAAQALLTRLRHEHPKIIVLDWHRDRQSQRRVQDAVEEALHENLPEESYDRLAFKSACERVYTVIYDRASQGVAWAA